MKFIFPIVFLLFLQSSCKSEVEPEKIERPKKVAQWLNPIFFNSDVEHEFNFPLWFNDSLIKAHEIYKITKRIFPKISGDTSEINNYKQAIPKEKIEYYFDPNGHVDQLIIYVYFDDREISRANFQYEGNIHNTGYRSVKMSPIMYLKKPDIKDQFSTDIYKEKIHPFSLLSYLPGKAKYVTFFDAEKSIHYYCVKNKKHWGPLSIDSIIHPKKEDWIVLGTMRKPYKRFHMENIVNESNVCSFKYWNSGVLKSRYSKSYPFENRRTYLYNKKHIWNAYVDSVFSNGYFITKIENSILFDQFNRPSEIVHTKLNDSEGSCFFKETFHYRTTIKTNK